MEVEDQQKSKLVTIEYCAKSTWTHVCEGFLTIGDICNYCQCPGDTISTGQQSVLLQCKVFQQIRTRTCLQNNSCNFCCLADSEVDCEINPTTNAEEEPTTSHETSPPLSTSESETISEVIVTSTDSSSIKASLNQKNNLIIIIGSTTGGLLVVLIVAVIILMLVVVVVYKISHKRENHSIERWSSRNRAAHSEGEQRYQETHVLGTLQNGCQETETDHIYQTVQPPFEDNVEPSDYEEFVPSVSVLTTTSNLPLISEDPHPYQVVVGSAGRVTIGENFDGLYDIVQDPKNTQQHKNQEKNNYSSEDKEKNHDDSTENHIYFTLEPDT